MTKKYDFPGDKDCKRVDDLIKEVKNSSSIEEAKKVEILENLNKAYKNLKGDN